MAKDKVTSNGEKNQEVAGKQEAPVIIDDAFYQIEHTSKMLRFLIEASCTEAAIEGTEFVFISRHMLSKELDYLNTVMEGLAKKYKGLIYRQVVASE